MESSQEETNKPTDSLTETLPASPIKPSVAARTIVQAQPWLDDLVEDLQSLSFNSTATTTDINRSTSSGSETTWTALSLCSSNVKPHASSGDPCWDGIRRVKSGGGGGLGLADLRFVQKLGSGDIGSVYLAELKCAAECMFAAKVMDKKELAGRNKEGRARTEKEILEMLDHPFLPTLYACLETTRWSCLLTDFCPGGDLHVLRQRQPRKRFDESSVRFYASEIVVALEYVHMMGIVYRDLKPENVLVRSDGHIMLTDFDLSLKCDSSASMAQIISNNQAPLTGLPSGDCTIEPPQFISSSCILPNCIVPAVSCFNTKRSRKKKSAHRGGPEFISEPMDVRSMSFVGTHEYLAPEIVSGEGHGSAVDWWTLGIFIYELLYGITPFRGMDNELTMANIVARALEFPKEPSVGAQTKDLITQLLVKDPIRRMGSTKGASAIKQHGFFQGVNWALLRCTTPPYVPPPFAIRDVSDDSCPNTPVEYF